MITEYTYIHQIELSGKLELLTPLHVGSGNSANSDLDILLDAEDKPYIPGTSIAGVIRHYINKHNVADVETFFGTARQEEDKSKQSRIIFYDSSLVSKKQKVKIRDGIRIDLKTGIVEDKAKYDYEILEPGVQFDFKVLLKYSDDDKENSKQFLKTLEKFLTEGSIQFGSNTSNGFGKVKLTQPKYNVYEIENGSVETVWNRIFHKQNHTSLDIKPLNTHLNQFSIQLIASIQNSLIIGDTDPDSESDKTHILSNGKPVITGSSLKGAIRSRIIRILNTISKQHNDTYYQLKYSLLGYVKEELEDKEKVVIKKVFKNYDAIQGKLKVSENIIEGTHAELQARIRIDRFTGGTIESALFDSMPQFSTNGKSKVFLEFSIDTHKFQEWEAAAGLLLLVLKDLWTGMLAIGGEKNVGRGRLNGESAIITWNEEKQTHTIALTNQDGKPYTTPKEDWEKLSKFIKALNVCIGK